MEWYSGIGSMLTLLFTLVFITGLFVIYGLLCLVRLIVVRTNIEMTKKEINDETFSVRVQMWLLLTIYVLLVASLVFFSHLWL